MFIRQILNAHILQWRVQEFARGGGEGKNLKGIFWLSIFQERSPAQKIAEKLIFPTKKVAKYR